MTMLQPSHYRRLRGERLAGRGTAAALGAAATLGIIIGVAPSLEQAAPTVAELVQQTARPTNDGAGTSPDASYAVSSAYYAQCSEARAAGVAPIRAGQPGYRSGLDADGDGVACEPYRWRR